MGVLTAALRSVEALCRPGRGPRCAATETDREAPLGVVCTLIVTEGEDLLSPAVRASDQLLALSAMPSGRSADPSYRGDQYRARHPSDGRSRPEGWTAPWRGGHRHTRPAARSVAPAAGGVTANAVAAVASFIRHRRQLQGAAAPWPDPCVAESGPFGADTASAIVEELNSGTSIPGSDEAPVRPPHSRQRS